MAGKTTALNPLAQVTSEVIAADPALAARIKKLIGSLIADAERTMKYGSPSERAALTRAIMPNMLRAVQTSEADVKETERRQGYERMMSFMRGAEKADAAPGDIGR